MEEASARDWLSCARQNEWSQEARFERDRANASSRGQPRGVVGADDRRKQHQFLDDGADSGEFRRRHFKRHDPAVLDPISCRAATQTHHRRPRTVTSA
jgi:hypothetical protein